MTIARFFVAMAGLGIVSGSTMAAPLNLQLESFPDVLSGFIDVSYTPVSKGASFFAQGFALNYEANAGPVIPINNGVFSLVADINTDGTFDSGNLQILGSLQRGLPLLLSGNLVALGFPDSGRGSTLEFLFNVTGGSLAGSFGATAGVILSTSGFTGWGSAWNNTGGFPGTGSAVADTAPPIPSPAPLAAFLALTGLAGSRRRR